MRTENLQGAALDWAVAKCEGVSVEYVDDGITRCLLMRAGARFSPSTNWAQGGPIIEREFICMSAPRHPSTAPWWAISDSAGCKVSGPTPLIAAMRCYVASKLGDTIDLPKELK
jgi:hypothetical protein